MESVFAFVPVCPGKDYVWDWFLGSLFQVCDQSGPDIDIEVCCLMDGSNENIMARWAEFERAWPNSQSFPTPLTSRHHDRCVHVSQLQQIGREFFLDSGKDWFWFVEADQPPPVDSLKKLLATGKLLVAGMTACRARPVIGAISQQGQRLELNDVDIGELRAVMSTGLGCTLVHCSIMEHIDIGDYEHNVERFPGGQDGYLMGRAREELGVLTYLDCSLPVPHCDQRKGGITVNSFEPDGTRWRGIRREYDPNEVEAISNAISD